MKRFSIAFVLILSAAVMGCGSDDKNIAPDADPNVVPPMPALSATQGDRMGRPAIATALQATFEPDQATRYAAKDAYNANASLDDWQSYVGAPPAAEGNYATGFIGSLAILDALNANCGDQLGADLDPDLPRYGALAGLLADDRLYVNSDSGDCTVSYLAVEADALGISPNDDCGGRTLSVDIADRSYSVLAAGALAGVTDGVAANDVELSPNFPYFAPANQ